MVERKAVLKHNGLERIKKYSVEEVYKWIEQNSKKIYIEIDGYKISIKRAKIFQKKGLTCVSCGVTGLFFALEKDKGGGLHLDLYGIIDCQEILITIDHIIPKSKGGLDKMINFQVMCKSCNESKADHLEDNFL